jgi:hypothetical protein
MKVGWKHNYFSLNEVEFFENEVRICLSPRGEIKRGEFQKNISIFRNKRILSSPSVPLQKGGSTISLRYEFLLKNNLSSHNPCALKDLTGTHTTKLRINFRLFEAEERQRVSGILATRKMWVVESF